MRGRRLAVAAVAALAFVAICLVLARWLNEENRERDAVLDVEQIARWAGCIGNRSTIVPIVDAKHDVFLSLAEPRAAAFREMGHWLDWYAEWSQSAGAETQSEQG